MYLPIRNSHDLKAEIYRLERLEVEQSVALKARFSSPSAVFSSIFSLFSTPGIEGARDAGFFKQDFVGLLSRFILPITLNKTIFRHSNFLVKTLVGVLSQKASHYISEDSVGGAWHNILSFFEKIDVKKPNGILGIIKSVFEPKKQKNGVNYPAVAPVNQNVLKAK